MVPVRSLRVGLTVGQTELRKGLNGRRPPRRPLHTLRAPRRGSQVRNCSPLEEAGTNPRFPIRETDNRLRSRRFMSCDDESAKLNGLNPQHYLADLLVRIADHPPRRIAELFPSSWPPRGATRPAP